MKQVLQRQYVFSVVLVQQLPMSRVVFSFALVQPIFQLLMSHVASNACTGAFDTQCIAEPCTPSHALRYQRNCLNTLHCKTHTQTHTRMQ